MKRLNAFTLIELMVVVAILIILLAAVLVAINPGKQLKNADDTKRTSDVQSILKAISQYAIEHNGDIPTAITTKKTEIGNSSGLIDLCGALTVEDTGGKGPYLGDIPRDPKRGAISGGVKCNETGVTYTTGYFIKKSGANNLVEVCAVKSDDTTPICVTQ